MQNPSISVVIPVYNSENGLHLLHKRLIDILEKITPKFEIIFVEDHGKDNSWKVIQDIATSDKRIKGLKMSRNYGQHNALLCGIRSAQNEIIVTIDDDLQNPPEEIPRLLSKLNEGFDVVYGTPQTEKHGLLRDLASQITKMVLQGAMGADTARMVSAFRIFRTQLRNAFVNYDGSFVSIDVLLTWGSTRFTALKVQHDTRKLGQSNYTIGKLIMHAMNMMTGFSVLPLQLASYTGFLFTLFGIGVFFYVLIRYMLFGTPVQGFPFLASIIAIFSGAQLFSLGIIGEYLARMHFRIMSKPSYNVLYKTSNFDGI
jgi:glycosyltransferase involved in cell wall biosynthesis